VEERETPEYQVEFTLSSKSHFYEVLEYLYEHYPLERAEQLADELEGMAQSLNHHPYRGAKEKWLLGLQHEYRFLLFDRTKRAEIKIIYYIQESEGKVYVTDFFPTEKDVNKMAERSS
jgi:plasmid stabilization system protein ParE